MLLLLLDVLFDNITIQRSLFFTCIILPSVVYNTIEDNIITTCIQSRQTLTIIFKRRARVHGLRYNNTKLVRIPEDKLFLNSTLGTIN